ncbi:MAG: alpha/beta fold hydrolase, partial [Chloroflexi bacterium]|nr:alpha/beta fold hydrolase [Chloroflexota bacterium]
MSASTKPDTPPLELLRDGPGDASHALVLAHGAGLAMDAPFMTGIAERVAAAGIEVVRFDFPYMRVQRATGRKRAPNAPRILLEAWWEVIAALGDPSRLVIGGKSMGGRVASAVADEAGVAGGGGGGGPPPPPRPDTAPRRAPPRPAPRWAASRSRGAARGVATAAPPRCPGPAPKRNTDRSAPRHA